MNEIKNINDLGYAVFVIQQLELIAKKVHRIDENTCNGDFLSEHSEKRAETRLKNLLKTASELAERLGLAIYHQGDPRGCSLYLIEKGQEDNYNRGVAL